MALGISSLLGPLLYVLGPTGLVPLSHAVHSSGTRKGKFKKNVLNKNNNKRDLTS